MFEGELVDSLMNVSDDSLIGVSGNEHEGLKGNLIRQQTFLNFYWPVGKIIITSMNDTFIPTIYIKLTVTF